MSHVLQAGMIEGRIRDTAEFHQALATSVNRLQHCNTHSVSQGCWESAMYRGSDEALQAGFVLHADLRLTGRGNASSTVDWIVIDLNGPQGPNALGEDTLELVVCIQADSNCSTGGWVDPNVTGQTGPGTITPGWGSLDLFNDLFD